MVLEGETFDDNSAVFKCNDSSGCREIRRFDANVAVGKALDVVQLSIRRGIVIDGVFGRQVLPVLRDDAVFDIDREGKRCHAWMRHAPIDLGDPVVFEAIE